MSKHSHPDSVMHQFMEIKCILCWLYRNISPKNEICLKFTHPQIIQDVEEFVFLITKDLGKFLVHLQWMGAVRMRVQTANCPSTTVVLSIKIHQHVCLDLFWTVFTCKQCLICAYFSPDSDEITFFTGESSIIDRGILAGSNGLKLKMS